MSRRIAVILSCVFILATLLPSIGCNINPHEQLITKLEATKFNGRDYFPGLGWYMISPDGKHIARNYYESTEIKSIDLSRNSKVAIVVDSSRGKLYDAIQWFLFSPDSKRYAYVGVKDKKYVVVVDGVEGKTYDYAPFGPSMEMPIIFSPNSRHVAYAVRTGPKNYIVVKDGVEGRQYDWPETHYSPGPSSIQMLFSPDSRTLAYVGFIQIPGKNPGICNRVVVQNEVEGKQYNGVYSITFSPDGQRIAYVADANDINNNNYFAVIDGVEGRRCHYQIPSILFSPDSKRTAYVATSVNETHHEGLCVFLDGIPGRQYATWTITGLAFSPDSQHLSYIVGSDVLITDGVEQKLPDRSHGVKFSPDSKRMAYIAPASTDIYERKWAVFLDEQPGKPYNDIFDLTFSPDSKHLAYRTYTGQDVTRGFVVSDGMEGPQYSNVTDIVYSSDGRLAYIAYKANINQQFVILNGVEGKYYDWMSRPAFSPDGKHLVYFAQERQDFFAVVDGVEMKHYERILGHERNSPNQPPSIRFDGSSTFCYMVLQERNVYLVTEKLN